MDTEELTKEELTQEELAFFTHAENAARLEASSTGQTPSRLQGIASAIKSFARFLEWSQGRTGFSFPARINEVTEEQWLRGGTYLQFLKWLEETATWGAAKKAYAPSTVGEYFRNILNAAHKSLQASYRALDRAFP